MYAQVFLTGRGVQWKYFVNIAFCNQCKTHASCMKKSLGEWSIDSSFFLATRGTYHSWGASGRMNEMSPIEEGERVIPGWWNGMSGESETQRTYPKKDICGLVQVSCNILCLSRRVAGETVAYTQI